MKVKRNDEIIDKKIKPTVYSDTGRGGLGIAIAEIGTACYPFLGYLGRCQATGWYLKEIVVAFYFLLKGIFIGNGVG